MFEGSEPDEAISFTDETSRQNKEKNSFRVWIHAQIYRYATLDWFKELRGLYPDKQGELKSSDVVNNYDKLPRDIRMRVSSGIRKARIHIVDTFSYEARFKQILREIYKCDNYEKMLQTQENQELTKRIVSSMEDFVTECILLDSPAQRLEMNLQAQSFRGLGYFLSLNKQQNVRKELAVDLKPFRKGNKRISDTASKWVSKSGSVFSDAVEFSGFGFLGEYESRQRIAEMLNESHAFDEGDDSSVKWIDEQRKHFTKGNAFELFGYLKPLYGKVDSKLSPRIQAADIIARIAQRIYDERGLMEVFDRFDYITFNGERITESNIKERIDYWNQITEREEKIQKLISKI